MLSLLNFADAKKRKEQKQMEKETQRLHSIAGQPSGRYVCGFLRKEKSTVFAVVLADSVESQTVIKRDSSLDFREICKFSVGIFLLFWSNKII